MKLDIPIGAWMERVVDLSLVNLADTFDAITVVIGGLINLLETGLLAIPAWLMIALIGLVSLWRVGWSFAIAAIASLGLIIGMGLWLETMVTLALILASAFFSVAFGLPLGILAAKSRIAESIIRPILDIMQTLPPFVYLIPAAMFFGLGKVPGTIATIIFSMPPMVRLTNLGIRSVGSELIEAGRAFGCTDRQLLFKVQLPIALPSIMAGLNQTIMLALSMVVIASMIGAGGLGNEVLAGLQRLDIGRGFEGGIAVVILAVLLDRITESIGASGSARSPLRRLWDTLSGRSPESAKGAR